ncbi:glyoxylate/hydroxypyruvate reductase B-like isoform X1 [Erythrolamprus reginae]|uniref:glyoxylate/hydroxypyruvate reductase B-like isoform X1 n=1 Tax=Erythrolamprus reginae TaxID=121349 RepID=UPI00396C4958
MADTFSEIVKKQELPYTLINAIGGPDGVYEDHVEFLEKHLKLVTMQKYLKNKQVLNEKIQAMFMWGQKPEATRELLEELRNLKVIAVSGVGIDHLDLKMIFGFGIRVTNTPFAVSNSTADLGMALMFASARRIVEGHQIAASPDTKYFNIDWLGQEITGATLGIIGMGRIGYLVAQRAKAFEMKILYHNRNQRNEVDEQAVGAVYCQKMEDLLPQADFVMLTVNLTPQTCKLIGRKELELMKPTATLINICRGQVIDQDALLKALQAKTIKAAALDVTYPEPLPRDHALLDLKNVLITPHIGTATSQARRHMMERMVESILEAVNGLPVTHEVHE